MTFKETPLGVGANSFARTLPNKFGATLAQPVKTGPTAYSAYYGLPPSIAGRPGQYQ